MNKEESILLITKLYESELGKLKKICVETEFINLVQYNVITINDTDILFGLKYLMGRFHEHAQHWGYDKEYVLCQNIIEAYQLANGIKSKNNKKRLPMPSGFPYIYTTEDTLSGIYIRQNAVISEIAQISQPRLISSLFQ